MKVTATKIPDVLIFEPKVFGDARGFFARLWDSILLWFHSSKSTSVPVAGSK